ncbi:MAG: hypothetical protein ACTSRA_11635, partial [Promethearchaeota archaeon]
MLPDMKFLIYADLNPVKSVERFIAKNSTFLPEINSLYLSDHSLTGAHFINSVFASIPLRQLGFEIYFEISTLEHSDNAIMSLILGALMHDINNIVLYESAPFDHAKTLKIMDEWNDQKIDFSMAEEGLQILSENKMKFYYNIGY